MKHTLFTFALLAVLCCGVGSTAAYAQELSNPYDAYGSNGVYGSTGTYSDGSSRNLNPGAGGHFTDDEYSVRRAQELQHEQVLRSRQQDIGAGGAAGSYQRQHGSTSNVITPDGRMMLCSSSRSTTVCQ